MLLRLFICKKGPALESVTSVGEVFLNLKHLTVCLYFSILLLLEQRKNCLHQIEGLQILVRPISTHPSFQCFFIISIFANIKEDKLFLLPTAVYMHTTIVHWIGAKSVRNREQTFYIPKVSKSFVQKGYLCKQL